MLQDKLKQANDGQLDKKELQEWFKSHPELADTANRSKRVKEQYRELMEAPITQQEASKETTPKKGLAKEESEEDRPLTIRELKKYDEERETRILEKALASQREDKYTSFAEKHKVVDDDASALKRNAEALFKANPDWSYDQALQGAYNTINPRKGRPNNISTGNLPAPESMVTKIDASAGSVQLISSSEFSGGQIK